MNLVDYRPLADTRRFARIKHSGTMQLHVSERIFKIDSVVSEITPCTQAKIPLYSIKNTRGGCVLAVGILHADYATFNNIPTVCPRCRRGRACVCQ